MRIDDFADKSPEFRPEDYFLGKTYAYGFFQDRFGTIRRHFTVEIDGYMDGDVLVLDEDFTYDDGSTDNRVWRLTIGPNGIYEGTAGDVVGIAKGQARGNALQFTYDFKLPVGDSEWQVAIDDWMFLQSDDVMLNRSTMSKFGIKIGEIFISFKKADAERSSLDSAAPVSQSAANKLYSPA